MSKRLAVTIAGAVSLGSFEAGVMYEVIRAIGEHNESAAQEDQILIDVLTGASAGGMTAAVTAQKLMFESAALGGPYTNDLYNAWVRDIDISEFLRDHPDDSDTKSIFSSGYVEDLSKRYITARYNAGPPRCGRSIRRQPTRYGWDLPSQTSTGWTTGSRLPRATSSTRVFRTAS